MSVTSTAKWCWVSLTMLMFFVSYVILPAWLSSEFMGELAYHATLNAAYVLAWGILIWQAANLRLAITVASYSFLSVTLWLLISGISGCGLMKNSVIFEVLAFLASSHIALFLAILLANYCPAPDSSAAN